VEQGGIWGLLHFTEPHCHAPLFFIVTALAFGLMGIAGLWTGINMAARLLVTSATVGGCLVVIQGVYADRHRVRETELLAWVKIKKPGEKRLKVRLSAQSKTILMPAMVVGLVMILSCALVQSDSLWALADWLLLEHEGEEIEPIPSEFRSRVVRALPLIFMSGYISFFPSLIYSSSMMLARQYAERMNRVVPYPIFLQDEKLAQVVRREAEVELGRLDPKSTNVISLMGYVQLEGQPGPQILRLSPSVDLSTVVGGPLSPQVKLWGQAATWVWDELARTDDGGIEMKVARQEVYRLPRPAQDSVLRPNPRVRYLVRADPWGRVIEVKRDAG